MSGILQIVLVRCPDFGFLKDPPLMRLSRYFLPVLKQNPAEARSPRTA